MKRILRETVEDTGQQTDQYSPTSSPTFESEKEFATFEDEKVAKNNDFLNVSQRFNRKNLQQCHKKNQQLIANNMRQFNHIRLQKGYNASLLTGKRYKSKTNNRLKNLTQLKASGPGNANEFLHRVLSPATGGIQTLKNYFRTAHNDIRSPKTD